MTEFEIQVIQKIQSLSTKWMDYLMFGITQFGGEVFFMAVAVTLLWCINKREGFRFINVYLFSQIVVGGLKIFIKRNRPFIRDKSIRAIIEKTDGYSMPSGHSLSIASISCQACLIFKRQTINKNRIFRIVLIAGIVLSILVAFSRVYLGQHYPSDVLTGLALGATLSLFFYYSFDFFKDKEEMLCFIIVPLSIIAAAIAIGFKAFDVIKVCGVYGGISLGYFIEKRYIKYDVKSKKLTKHILKLFIGSLILLFIKQGLKFVTELIDPYDIIVLLSDYLRYFFMGLFASLFAPMLFKKLKI